MDPSSFFLCCFLLRSLWQCPFPNDSCIPLSSSFLVHHSLLWSPAEHLTSLPVTLEPNAVIDSLKSKVQDYKSILPNFDGHHTWFL